MGRRVGFANVAALTLGFVPIGAAGTLQALAQQQATWFVDPQNVSGVASDFNSGLDAQHPVLSYNGGIAAKWGTTSPTLAQNTTITFLSAHVDDSDPVVCTPFMKAAVLVIQGQLGTAQKVASGVLGVVVAKNRATAQLLNADLLAAVPAGTLVHNTTAGKDSYAWTFRNIAGTTWSISQPLIPTVAPFDSTMMVNAAAEVDTWALGDTYIAYAPMNVYIVKLAPTILEYVVPSFAAQVQLLNVVAWSPVGPVNNSCFIGSDVTLLQCGFTSTLCDQSDADDEQTFWANVYVGASVISGSSNPTFISVFGGVILADLLSLYVSASFEFDAIISASAAFAQATLGGLSPFFKPWTYPYLGSVYIDGVVGLVGTWNLSGANALTLPSRVWGPGTLDGVGCSRIYLAAGAGAAAATLLCTAVTLNGQANANLFDPATGLFAAAGAITAAAIDAATAGNPFVNVGGACITKQATP